METFGGMDHLHIAVRTKNEPCSTFRSSLHEIDTGNRSRTNVSRPAKVLQSVLIASDVFLKSFD
jgi:hypothetical protein